MSELRFEKFSVKGHRLGKASWFPAIRELIKSEISAKLDEDDNLFIGYGMMPDSLPYTLLDNYDTPEEELSFNAAVLENKYLKAVFLPQPFDPLQSGDPQCVVCRRRGVQLRPPRTR